MSGETVVNVEVGKIDPDNMPALTLCHRALLNITNFLNSYTDEIELYKLWNLFSRQFSKLLLKSEKFQTFYQNITKLFYMSIWNNETDYAHFMKEGMSPLFEFSIAFKGKVTR